MNLINNSLLAYYIRRARRWTPAALFAQGQQGVWYEPKPEYLYQDAAGTVPVTADGDPVGYMQDLSGNGNHATQSTSAARPIYRTNGVLHWLQFDGVDDFMDMATPSIFSAKLHHNIFYAGELFGSSDEKRLVTVSTDSRNAARFVLFSSGFSNSGKIALGHRRLNSDSYNELAGPDGSGKQVISATANRTSGEVVLRVNGGPAAGETVIAGASGATDSVITRIGGQDSLRCAEQNLFGIVVSDGNYDFHAVGDVEKFLANLAGVTL